MRKNKYFNDKGVFDMHNHLQDMGWIIAEKEKEGTQRWEAVRLSTISNNINLSGLQLKRGNPQRFKVLYSPGLGYLYLQNVLIEDMIGMLPRHKRLKCLPDTYLSQLQHLDL